MSLPCDNTSRSRTMSFPMDFSSTESPRMYREKLENKQPIRGDFARVVIETSEENVRSMAKRQDSGLASFAVSLRSSIYEDEYSNTQGKVSSIFLTKGPSSEFVANLESTTGPRDFLELAHHNHTVKKTKIEEEAKKMNESSPRYSEKLARFKLR